METGSDELPRTMAVADIATIRISQRGIKAAVHEMIVISYCNYVNFVILPLSIVI